MCEGATSLSQMYCLIFAISEHCFQFDLCAAMLYLYVAKRKEKFWSCAKSLQCSSLLVPNREVLDAIKNISFLYQTLKKDE